MSFVIGVGELRLCAQSSGLSRSQHIAHTNGANSNQPWYESDAVCSTLKKQKVINSRVNREFVKRRKANSFIWCEILVDRARKRYINKTSRQCNVYKVCLCTHNCGVSFFSLCWCCRHRFFSSRITYWNGRNFFVLAFNQIMMWKKKKNSILNNFSLHHRANDVTSVRCSDDEQT